MIVWNCQKQLVCPTYIKEEKMKTYMDTSLSAKERAELLLRELSLDEKLAQLTGVFFINGMEKRMAPFFKNGIGQISTLGFRMLDSMEEAAAKQRELQTIVMENSAHHIPAVFHMEGSHWRPILESREMSRTGARICVMP